MNRSLLLVAALLSSSCMSRATQPPPGGGPQPIATATATADTSTTRVTPTPAPSATTTATPATPATTTTARVATGVLVPIEDVFYISGRGTVATGQIKRGTVKVGDELELLGMREPRKVTVTGIEMFRKMLDVANAGDNVGLLLRGVEKNDVERGQVLAAPGSMQSATKFTADITMLTVRTTPIKDGYRPQVQIHTAGITGALKLSSEIAPGGSGRATIDLVSPQALEVGATFALLEGGKAVGKGTIVSIP